MVVKFSTLAGGVWIEQRDEAEYGPRTRCFRFDSNGNAEWASYTELKDAPDFARWFGFMLPANQFSFA